MKCSDHTLTVGVFPVPSPDRVCVYAKVTEDDVLRHIHVHRWCLLDIQDSQYTPTEENYRRLGCARKIDKHNLIHEYRYYPVGVCIVTSSLRQPFRDAFFNDYFGDGSLPLLL